MSASVPEQLDLQVVPYDLFEAALRLDGPTLQNLDLLETEDGQSKGSLMAMLDTCTSAGNTAEHTIFHPIPLYDNEKKE